MTLHERGLDDDTLYKQNSEAAAGVSLQKGKKRGATQVNKGRAVSIAKVWEYTDEGDVASHNQGADFESSFPKRRKSASVKRTKSAPSQPKHVQYHHTQEAPTPDLMHDTEQPEEEQGSQLTTPPDSGKRQSKKKLPKPRNTSFKPGPFRNPIITKLSVPRDDKERTLTKPVTIHQGWTSTQDSVKNHNSGLSKTTLDKLAAFRYKSSVEAQVNVSSAIGRSLPVEEAADAVEILRGPRPSSSSDYGFVADNDSMFVGANLVDHAPAETELPAEYQLEPSQRDGQESDHHREGVFFSDAVWDPNADGTVMDEVPFSPGRSLTPHTMNISGVHVRNPSGSISTGDASESLIVPLQIHLISHTGPNGTQYSNGSNDPSSMAKRNLAEMMDETVFANQRIEYNAADHIHQSGNFGFDEYEETAGDVFEQHQNIPHFQLDHHLFFHPYNSQDEASNHLQRGQIASANLVYNERLSNRIVDIQVARSDNEEPQMALGDVSNDFELDDFDDEGIDDADLLAISSEGVIPETQPLVPRTHTAQLEVETTDVILAQDCRLASPELLSDDEFPLEDGLEEEDLVSLPTHLQGVIETFQAPPSLEYSFGCGPMSGEVYDKSLQFSPPKSRPSSVLQARATGLPITDGHSPAKLQVDGETGLDPAEEEDWSFIRSIDGANHSENPVASDPAFDQENTSPDKTAKCAIPLGPQKQRKRSIYPKIITAATQSSTLEEIVVDDSHEYEPLQPFARPDFPSIVLDRCPIPGVTAQTFLRVCFRVGEMFREGARCNALKQDAIIELFARVTFSSREPGTTQQHFQFADLWHDRPPFPNGILANYKTSGLAESESRAFVGAEEHMMARCIGRLRRNAKKNATGWFIDIINIRPTDWEEVKWTKRIVSAGLVKSEKGKH
ncbi:hypothetical protein VTL71DRAFT_14286 [Oculimacula yallundae]|uniref:Uncharacterized protein n=1 Tax=Oculimacula yallundae TaxID=86028 RepID=A0ABR4CI14_9HELO